METKILQPTEENLFAAAGNVTLHPMCARRKNFFSHSPCLSVMEELICRQKFYSRRKKI
ncbi:MAG: hypothetical protein IKO05_00995 [Selenomonadaceae bacterium]|nr:hypothetical protein [Selenomonadaceae bacterium]